MALIDINQMKYMDKERNKIHEPVYSTYTVFEMNGEKFVQLDTYGRKDRKNPEKISQSIQIDRTTALRTVDFLKTECGCCGADEAWI